MARLPLRIGIPLLACWLAGFAATQAPPERSRVPTFVQVVDSDGEPLANARITLVGAIPEADGVGGEARHAVSDARGRAIVRLRPDLCHVAWAIGPADAAGAAPYTPQFGFFAAGAMVELRCGLPQPLQRVTIGGLSAWSDRGPLTVHLIGWHPSADLELVRDGDAWLLPPTPLGDPVLGVGSALEVRCGGRPLHLFERFSRERSPQLPPPQRVAVRVVDEEGEPLPGAPLDQRLGTVWPWTLDGTGVAPRSRVAPLGVADATGTAVVEVAYPGDPLREPGSTNLQIVARALGRERLSGGVYQGSSYVDDVRLTQPPGAVLQLTARRVADLAGRLDGLPAGTFAHLAFVAQLDIGSRGVVREQRSQTVPVGADGSFRFVGVPRTATGCRLVFWHPDREIVAPVLLAEAGCRLPALASLPLVPCRVRVVDAVGNPARGGVLLLGPGERTSVLLSQSVARRPLDASGSANLLLPRGSIAVFAVCAEGSVGKVVQVDAGATHDLQLQPFTRLRVRFVDHRGVPIAGARPTVSNHVFSGSGDPVGAMVQPFHLYMLQRLTQQVTDRNGRIELVFPADRLVNATVELRSAVGWSPELILEADGEEMLVRPR
jgi:hypothetical protein